MKKLLYVIAGMALTATQAEAQSQVYGQCTFSPPPPIPTLGGLGIFALMSLVLACGIFVIRRRDRATIRRFPMLGAIFLVITCAASATWAHNLMTSQGHNIVHSHRPVGGENELTGQDMALRDNMVSSLVPATPNTRTQIGEPTITYDCHGKTFDGSGSWINDNQVQQVLNDDYSMVPAGMAHVGDIVVYRQNGSITHSGIVTGIDANGNVIEVCSKWGDLGEYLHKPNEVPQGQMGMVGGQQVQMAMYGTPTVYRKN